MSNVSDASAEIMKIYALRLIEQIMSQDNYVFNTANAVDLLCDCYIALSEYNVNSDSESLRTIRQDPNYRLGVCRQLLFIVRDGIIHKDNLFNNLILEDLNKIILT